MDMKKMKPEQSDTSMPTGVTPAEDPKFPEGSKITLNADHMEGMKGAQGTVVKAVTGTFYMVDYKPTDGSPEVTNHKWMAEGELKADSDSRSNSEHNINVEIRSVSRYETRDDDQGNHIISGYAIVFNQPSCDMGFIERIDPKALANVDVSQTLALYNHEYGNILARVDANTLKLTVDDKGLAFTCVLPHTTLGNDVYENINNGNIRGCSFGFTVADDEWSVDKDGKENRLITQLGTLSEISLTTIPAYEETSVKAVRSKALKMRQCQRDKLARIKALLDLELIELDSEK